MQQFGTWKLNRRNQEGDPDGKAIQLGKRPSHNKHSYESIDEYKVCNQNHDLFRKHFMKNDLNSELHKINVRGKINPAQEYTRFLTCVRTTVS